jgi:hypothetical protein
VRGDTLGAMRRPMALPVLALLTLAPATAYGADASWEQWRAFAGVFDVDGPRADGSLIVAGSAALYLVDPGGTAIPFARGPGGYHEDPGAEAYLALSRGGHVNAANCDFAPDETYLLRLHVPIGINRVNAAGDESGPFVNLTGVDSLNGITFDTTGSFDRRLLVTGASGGKTVVFAIDCTGAVQTITRSAPVLEGGLAVAPSSFGSFGGALIAPDELSGKIYAVGPTGEVTQVAKPALPTGGDIGVESVAFVPPGLITRGGAVYYADRLTPGNPHPGTDSLLRLGSTQLAAAGVQEGDLLVVTEGGATMVAVRCGAACTVIPVVAAATKAHGEGHIAFTIEPPPPSPVAPSPRVTPVAGIPPQLVAFMGEWGIPTVAVALLLALVLAVGVPAAMRRRRRGNG